MVTADVEFLELSPVHCRRVWTTTREGMLEIYREIPFTRQVKVINKSNNLLPFTGPSTRKLNYSVYKPPPFINSPGSDIRHSLLFLVSPMLSLSQNKLSMVKYISIFYISLT